MNRLGQADEEKEGLFGGILFAVFIIIILAVLAVGYLNPIFEVNLSGAPEFIKSTFDVVVAVLNPIVSGIYFVVAPTGPDTDDNVRMIAFAIFMLLVLVGIKTLKPFIKPKFLAFSIAVIIGIIAARSLTATVLKESALSASPLAAVSLILGFIPLYAITQNIKKWDFARKPMSRMVVYTVVAAVYLFFFWSIFKVPELGFIYSIGIMLLGITEIVYPLYRRKKALAQARGAGVSAGQVRKTIAEAEEMSRGWRESTG